jgi:rSAM/selenodomain-associated transferase 1
VRPRLVIFAKAPVIGGAKSRLARGVGRVAAWRLYRAMTAKVIRNTRDARWDTVLAVSPDRAAARSFSVWPAALARVAQGRGDLGRRQARALAGRGPVCVIGTDAPQVRRGDVARAFAALKRHDAVIGPAEDGGYWLLALNAPAPRGLFENVRWSHPETRSDLVGRLEDCGLGRVALLRTLRDVDEAGDLRG